MNHSHSQKRKRSNDSIEEFHKDKKRSRREEVSENLYDSDNKDTIQVDFANTSNYEMTQINQIQTKTDEIKSKVYKSKQKNNLMNAIWTIDIPSSSFGSNFSQKMNIKARENIPCNTLLDFNYARKEFIISIQIGEGEDIEKKVEEQRLIEKMQVDSLNHIKKPIGNDNAEEIKIDDILSFKSESKKCKSLNRFDNSSKSMSSQSCRITDQETKNNNGNIEGSKKDEEAQLKLDLLAKHSNSPNIRDQKIRYIHLKNRSYHSDENCDKKYNADNRIKLNLANNIKYEENSNRKDNPALKIEDSYNVTINLCIISNKFMNFSFHDVTPGQVKTEVIKISDENYVELTDKPYSHRIPNGTFSQAKSHTIPIIIQINITKNLSQVSKYIGIINEGTTCYMNSILQSLNFLGYFKNAVFQIPISKSDNATQSVEYSLQKLFFDLMTEHKAVSAYRLIKSFGWSKEEMLIQHDVQEFNLCLSEIMENKMKGTNVEGTFKYLFEGKITNYIECLNVDYKSVKDENFLDLQLTVKGCDDIYQSFDKYTEEEILDHENKYDAGIYGKQVAKKGVKFLELPNVLILQLKRFEYNFQKDSMEKVNDYFEFYNEINLSKYLTNTKGDIKEHEYSLHTVLVHSGFPNTGHYFAYIKPEINSRWLKFNDEEVKIADEYEVFENNYGGELNLYRHVAGEIIKNEFISDSNAYILIYIKNSKKESILRNVSQEDIPQELKDLFKEEKLEEAKQILKEKKDFNNIDIYMFSKEILFKHNNLGITPSYTNLDEGISFTSVKNRVRLSVPREMKIIDLIKYLSIKTNIPEDKIMLYKYALLYNNIPIKRFFYQANQIDKNNYNCKMRELFNYLHPVKSPCMLYVHIADNSYEFIEENNSFQLIHKTQYENKSSNHEEIISKITEILCNQTNSYSFETKDEDYFSIILNDEFNPSTKSNQIISFSKNENFWKFKTNQPIPSCERSDIDSNLLINEEWGANTQTDDSEVICIIKYVNLKCIDEKSYETKLEIGDILTLKKFQNLSHLNNLINFKERYKNFLDENLVKAIPDYDNSQVGFFIESCSYDEISSNRVPCSVFLCKLNSPIEIIKNSMISLVVNLSWKDKLNIFNQEINSLYSLITECCNNLMTTISCKFNYLVDRRKSNETTKLFNKAEKMRLNQTEFEIKRMIQNFFKKDSESEFINDIFDLEKPFDTTTNFLNYYISHSNSNLITIQDFISLSSSDVIKLFQSADYNRENMQFFKDYPLTRFLHKNVLDFNIIFGFNLNISLNKEISDTYMTDFFLFDIDNNIIAKLALFLPKNINKFSDILLYLKEKNILKKFYPLFESDEKQKVPDCKISSSAIEEKRTNLSFEDVKLNLDEVEDKIKINNFYYILQNPDTKIAYDIITNRIQNILEYESKQNIISYRIQPYYSEDLHLINDKNKIFFSILDNELNPAYFPIVLCLDKASTKLITMKNIVIEKMKKIGCLSKIYEEDFKSKNCFSRIKFYISCMIEFKPKQLLYLHQDKDEKLLTEIFDTFGPHNMIVKLPSRASCNLVIKN